MSGFTGTRFWNWNDDVVEGHLGCLKSQLIQTDKVSWMICKYHHPVSNNNIH